ncbi:MAG: DUF6443 domain-containing protein, partial [Prevotellaceae bacterium]|nr:DUF6443 domain-containing protein [Prevotellaceae bacterium]
MKKYFITIILSTLFCGNMFSQDEIVLPHVIIDGIINSNNTITADCNGGYYTLRMRLSSSSYNISEAELRDMFCSTLTNAGYYPHITIPAVEFYLTTNQVLAGLRLSSNTTNDISLILNGEGGGYIIVNQTACPPPPPPPPDPITGDATNANWILKTTYTEPNAAQYYRDITYYDGLGYPEQVIRIKGSPMQKNMVTPVYYDNMRRDNAKVYLPYVSGNSTAAKENLPFTTQSAFYQDKFGTEDGQYAYVENVFEPSPLNRI